MSTIICTSSRAGSPRPPTPRIGKESMPLTPSPQSLMTETTEPPVLRSSSTKLFHTLHPRGVGDDALVLVKVPPVDAVPVADRVERGRRRPRVLDLRRMVEGWTP